MKNIRIAVIILALLVLAAVTGKSQTGVDPGNPDTLYVDSVTAYTSGIAVVPVSFYNDESLFAIEITLIQDSPDVTIDSFPSPADVWNPWPVPTWVGEQRKTARLLLSILMPPRN